MTSTADIWQCFTDNTLAYVDPNNESIHELLYASLGIYGAALCALMASRCRLGRDANTLRLMLQFLQSFCVVWYGVVTMWSIIPASQNHFKICFADSAAPSSGCVNYVQTFSGVSTAATIITILGAWIPITFTFYARTQPSLTTNPSPSFRALRYVLMFAGDVLTLLITPGYIAVESRELDLGNCLLSPLALYERELSGTHIGILCVLALACGIDLIRVQWGSADSCVASVVMVVVTIVWGLSVSVARMATTQAGGWVPYLGSVWVPVFVAVLHELLFLCLIGRPWWFDDPPEESLTAAAVNPADVTVGVVVVGDGDVDTPTVVDATVVSLPTQPIHDVTIVSS